MSGQGKGSAKRKRIKVECMVCHQQFDDDYRKVHNQKQHADLIRGKKFIGYRVANAPKNPFEAAKKKSKLGASSANQDTPKTGN